MSIRWSDIVSGAPAPGLASLDVAAQDAIIEVVEEVVNPDVLGGSTSARYTRAKVYLAAHMGQLAVDAAGGASGPVTSKSADGLAKSYAVWGSTDRELDRTSWGQLYRMIVRNSPARAGMVI